MKNARAKQRWRLLSQLRVYHKDTKELVGHLFDVSTEGFRLISDAPIETDQVYKFYMDMSDDLSEPPICQITARSIWSKQDLDPSFFDSGFQLVDVSNETKAHLHSLIKQLKS